MADTFAIDAIAVAQPVPGLLQLIWLASPGLPVGGFSYSEGLEAGVAAGLVGDEAGAAGWIGEQLWLGLARGDLAVLAAAVEAARIGDAARLRELDDWILHTRESAELRLQCEQMGRSMAQWLRNRDGAAPLLDDGRRPTYPVAFALAAATSPVRTADVCAAYAFAWAENLVQAAVKAVPLGQNAGQRILGAVVAQIPAAVESALALDDGERQAFSPMLAILSARHEEQYSRLFRS